MRRFVTQSPNRFSTTKTIARIVAILRILLNPTSPIGAQSSHSTPIIAVHFGGRGRKICNHGAVILYTGVVPGVQLLAVVAAKVG
jgi:hypothetical protein